MSRSTIEHDKRSLTMMRNHESGMRRDMLSRALAAFDRIEALGRQLAEVTAERDALRALLALDRPLVMSHPDVPFKVGDRFECEGDAYEVINLDPDDPDGFTVHAHIVGDLASRTWFWPVDGGMVPA